MNELRHRDPLLFWAGALMVLTLIVVTLISIGDARQILGLNPWIKPMKFLTSITIFLWSFAWFMPETEARPVARSFVRWTFTIAMMVEIALIIMQSWRGTTSHFNSATPFDDAVFGIMGLGVVFNTVAVAVFLWIIRRDTPANRAGYIWGIRLGVAMFLLASLEGALIVSNNAHSVPGPDGGPGLPFVNWSTDRGDLRTAHFFGMHGLQALPLLGFVLDRARVSQARNVVVVTALVWVVTMGGLMVRALQGKPLLAL